MQREDVALQVFEKAEFGVIRMLERNGKPYFVANDVAKALGYANPKDAVTRHCKGALFQRYLTEGGEQELKVIPEGDLYRLIVKSKLPAAETFETWIFEEVLPSIRQNGGYIEGQESLSEEELLAKALLVAQQKILQRDKIIAEKEKRIEQMHPKEIFADAVAASYTSILVGDLAKLIQQNGVKMGSRRLFAWMRENGYLIRRSGSDWNLPTQRSMELGLFEVKESTISLPDGSVRIIRTTKVTGKGQQYFLNKFLGKDRVCQDLLR